jgi:hypothetical protein
MAGGRPTEYETTKTIGAVAAYVAEAHSKNYLPTIEGLAVHLSAHELVKLTTEWGFTGIDGDRRARELATNDARVRPDWHGYVERVDGADIGEDKRFVYFRFVPRKQKAATMEEWFEALPAAAS